MAEFQAVIFELAGVSYGIDILHVKEIMQMVEITPVAQADMAMEGIVNLRGQVIPVINLSRRLGLTKKESNPDTRVVVVELEGKRIGLVVDRVLEVGKYKETNVEKADIIGNAGECISGFVKKEESIWLLLNISALSENINYLKN